MIYNSIFKKNDKTNKRVIVLAPSRLSRGGISSVSKRLEKSDVLLSRRAMYLFTMDNRSFHLKLLYFLKALLTFPFFLPFVEIVHAHISSGISFYRKGFFLFFAKLCGKRIIVHIHPSHFVDFVEKGNYLRKIIVSSVLSRADSIIVLSPFISERLVSVFPWAKISVLPNPCTYEIWEDRKSNDDVQTILFTGKLMDLKGCNELLDAFAEVSKNMKSLRLIMAGDGEIDKYKEKTIQLGIDDKVFFPGWLEGDSLLEIYRKSKVFCLPSYSEGMPMSLLEAMSQEMAIVATPVGGIVDVIEDNVNGLLVPVRDVNALANALHRVFSSDEKRRKLASAAKMTVKEYYSLSVISNKLECIYGKL